MNLYFKLGLENIDSELLPSPPVLINKVIELTQGDQVEIECYVNLINQDPTTAMKTLKIANSAYFGVKVSKNATTIKEAVLRLGVNTTENIVITSILEQSFQSSSENINKVLTQFWFKSLFLGKTMELMGGNYLDGLFSHIGGLPILLALEEVDHNLEMLTESDLLQAIAQLTPQVIKQWDLKIIIDNYQFFYSPITNLDVTLPIHHKAAVCYAIYNNNALLESLVLDEILKREVLDLIEKAKEYANSVIN
jgi:hypothetical protein